MTAEAGKLTGVYFTDCEHAPVAVKGWEEDGTEPVLQQAVEELREYFGGGRTEFTVPLHYGGTPFQHEIWRQIALIPFGETITYTELAERAGQPSALRAAGSATGRNPIGVIIPCHRIVAKNGGLGGYAGGLERKKRLLEIETGGKQFKFRAPSSMSIA